MVCVNFDIFQFMVKHFKGSNVTYVWNFGDGTVEKETDEMRLFYTYNR